MPRVTFITGNQGKADFLARHINHPIVHQKIDLDEIQSLDLAEIATHKARQAFSVVGSPILVEDVSFTIKSMGKLPGPFIKWFEQELGLDGICSLVDSLPDRTASIAVCFVYFDGDKLKLFNGSVSGEVAKSPRGTNGFGFDPIFIRDEQTKTLAEMTDEELEKYSLRTTTVYPQIKQFLASLDNNKT